MCEHEWEERFRHENDNRVRTLDICRRCGTPRYGCQAKRLDGDGGESWGKVGVWGYSGPRELFS